MRVLKTDWRLAAVAAAALALTCDAASAAGQLDAQNFQADIDVLVAPTASIQIVGGNLLFLRVPPPGSTIPSHGVTFKITGNANATVTAAPDSFVFVPTDDAPAGEYLGNAVLNGNSIGYKLRLDFPVSGVVGSPAQFAGLPGFAPGPTTPPLTVNLMLTGGTRNGRIHMESNEHWTPSGGIPLPGIYVGAVTLTVSAN